MSYTGCKKILGEILMDDIAGIVMDYIYPEFDIEVTFDKMTVSGDAFFFQTRTANPDVYQHQIDLHRYNRIEFIHVFKLLAYDYISENDTNIKPSMFNKYNCRSDYFEFVHVFNVLVHFYGRENNTNIKPTCFNKFLQEMDE